MPESLRQSIPIAIESVEKNTQDKVIDVCMINKNRHCLLTTNKHLRYYLLFKRDFFRSFGKIFNKDGLGESINIEYLKFCKQNEIDAILIVYQIGHVYTVPVQEWWDYAQNNNTIRETISEEITMSIPLRLLRRWR